MIGYGKQIASPLTAALVLALLGGLSSLGTSPLTAQSCGGCPGADIPAFVCSFADSTVSTDPCPGSFPNCVPPVVNSSRIDVIAGSGGNFEARLVVSVTAPSNNDTNAPDFGRLNLYWAQGSTPLNPTNNLCQDHTTNRAETYIAQTVNCAGAPYDFGTYSLRAVVCEGASCQKITDAGGLAFMVTKSMLGCPVPPPENCNEPSGDASGASGETCMECRRVGGGNSGGQSGGGGSPGGGSGGSGGPGDPGDPGCASGLDGTVACSPGWSGPGAFLHYASNGPGNAPWPGAAGSNPWQMTLGRNWSHDHAERIVTDPDSSHVWLITRYGSFKEFSAPDGTGLYQHVAPSDEYRQLFLVGSAWQLKGLDGSVEYFLANGLWDKTVLPADLGHPIQGSYTGTQLTAVSFPDGRSETYSYYTSGASTGKLHTITENGVAGSPALSRTWTYLWSGDDLVDIQRPDLTTWEFTYATNGAAAGYLSQVRLVGTDLSGRVMAAFQNDATGTRPIQSWRGDPVFSNASAVDKQTFTYTLSGSQVTQNVATETVSATYTDSTTFNLGMDTVSRKTKVLSFVGTCPTCGLAPSTSFEFTDGTNPLLPTAMIDGRGIRTELTYGAHGRMTVRKENVVSGVPQRTTTYVYDTHFPGLVAEIDQPSTSGGSHLRTTLLAYDPTTSDLSARTDSGFESGVTTGSLSCASAPGAYSCATAYTYNSAGRPLTIDPPGFGTADQTVSTYNVAGRNGYLPDTRVDPLVGTTIFGYDGLNRRTSVVDPNGVAALTSYDALDRLTQVRQQGASPPTDDLVTSYTYDVFGDLACVQLPRGNGIAYAYDSAGRMTEMRRQADCNPATQALERTVYAYDGADNRSSEDRQRWTGSAWSSDSKTEYIYSCHLDKMTQGKGSAAESVTEYCYDEDFNLKQTWDANHPRGNPASPNPSTLTYTYDNLNRLTRASQPWTTGTADTQYTYDIQDHLAQVTDAEGNVTAYTTSDRSLLTQQTSPVSGTTSYVYNEHGQMTSQTDARGVVTTRTLDALDRATQAAFSDGTPAVVYGYDAPCAFGRGRLCSVVEGGSTVAYSYDRFSRTLQDGALTYAYDTNGNRAQIGYPGGLTAAYSFDFADRPATLSYNAGAGSVPVVVAASYLSSGPLSALSLANGLTETHAFDARYYPSAVTVAGAASLNWSYAIDGVGNITGINDGTTNRVYGYVDQLYFLKQGDGPWGTRSWTYDRIGNRLTEARGTTTDTYTYLSGHNPRLASIALGGGAGTRRLLYDTVGNELQESGPTTQLDLSYDGANRLIRQADESTKAATSLTYDGRNFLVQARQDLNSCSPVATQSTYTSEGLLLRRSTSNELTGAVSKDTKILYFAGRPVAFVETATPPAVATYLAVDHLGTPILETTAAGTSLWSGGFEPFGKDWNGAQTAGEFLRFPGQWEDAGWSGVSGAGFEYNVRRWYVGGQGRYSQADPLGLTSGPNVFSYVSGAPTRFRDPLGLAIMVCSREVHGPVGLFANHSYVWDTRKNTGKKRFCEAFSPAGNIEGGPDVDTCSLVADSDGKEDKVLGCCEKYKTDLGNNIYVPFLNDCQTNTQSALACAGLGAADPGIPGGRLGCRSGCSSYPQQPWIERHR